jgi:hypothetical protein
MSTRYRYFRSRFRKKTAHRGGYTGFWHSRSRSARHSPAYARIAVSHRTTTVEHRLTDDRPRRQNMHITVSLLATRFCLLRYSRTFGGGRVRGLRLPVSETRPKDATRRARVRSLPFLQYDDCMDGGVQPLFGRCCNAPATHAGLYGVARRQDLKPRAYPSQKEYVCACCPACADQSRQIESSCSDDGQIACNGARAGAARHISR